MRPNEPTDLVASAARSVNGAGDAIRMREGVRAFSFLLDMTAPLTDAGDKIDIFVQDSPDNGDTWNDLVAFVQVLGNAAASKQIAMVNCEVTPTTPLAAPSDGSLTDGVRQGPVCPTIRAKWVVTKDADNPEDQGFTFSISVWPIR